MKFSGLDAVSCVSAKACTAVGFYATRYPVIIYSVDASSASSAAGFPLERALATRWNGRRWVVQRTPNPPGAQDGKLVSVSCASATACMAVGDAISSSGKQTIFAERWNGRAWSIQKLPELPGATSSLFGGVSCASARTCIAVGSYYTTTGSEMFVARWDGQRWSLQRTPAPAGGFLAAVSCFAANECTAVGGYAGPHASRTFPGDLTLAERWNGHRWTIQRTPNPTGVQDSRLLAVSCASATACTAIGWHATGSLDDHVSTLAESWNGQRWHLQGTPSPGNGKESLLNEVSCTAATACTAVGAYTTGGATNGVPHTAALVERYSRQ